MSHSAELAVVIPTFNGQTLLQECLEALRRQTFTHFRIYVVDNASTDDTRAMLASDWPAVRCVALDANIGFCGAINAGVRASDEPFVFLLNNDAFAEPDMLAQLMARAHAHADESIWAAALVYAHDPQMLESAGVSVRTDGTPSVLWRDRPVATLPEQPQDVFGPCGAAALFRRSVFDTVGLFDERFLFYGDDTDVALRTRLAGFGCMLVPAARGRHRHRATSSKRPNLTDYLQHRNTVLYLIKSMPTRFLLRRLPRFLFSGLRPLLRAPWRGTGWSILGAKFGILRHLCYAWGQRRRIRSEKKISDTELLALLDRNPAP